MPSEHALSLALQEAAQRFVDNPAHAAHRCFIGLRKVKGVYTDDVCVVVCVPEKKAITALSADEVIPSEITVRTSEPVRVSLNAEPWGAYAHTVETVPVDVQAEPVAEIELLRLLPGHAHALITAQALAQQQCQQPTIGGGAQIQPRGANWVGTLGGMAVANGRVIAITNAHVTGLDRAAHWPMHQPSKANGRYFALVQRTHEITVGSGGKNLVDLAVLDPRDADGKHTVKPEQIGLGKLGTQALDAKLGMRVVKSGRTTGATRGRCVGVKGISSVGYDAGKVARFVDQDIFAADSGHFSQAGDSGSFILQEGTNHLVALLFAGGGNQTIGNPARHVLAAAEATLYGG